MKRICLACAVWLGLMWAGPVAAQDDIFSQPVLGFIPKPGWPPSGPVPRLADGKPDLSGPWAPNALRINNNTDSVVKDIPMQPWAADILKQRRAVIGKDDPEGLCLPMGTPRKDPYPWKIVQAPQLFLILYEGNVHSYRQVFLDGRPHDPNVTETWWGDSIGKWDGDALVVDTVGLNDKAWLDLIGHPRTEKAHIVERFTRPDRDHMNYEVTIDDPKAFTKPWKNTRTWVLMAKDEEIMEYVCVENNKEVSEGLIKNNIPKQ